MTLLSVSFQLMWQQRPRKLDHLSLEISDWSNDTPVQSSVYMLCIYVSTYLYACAFACMKYSFGCKNGLGGFCTNLVTFEESKLQDFWWAHKFKHASQKMQFKCASWPHLPTPLHIQTHTSQKKKMASMILGLKKKQCGGNPLQEQPSPVQNRLESKCSCRFHTQRQTRIWKI